MSWLFSRALVEASSAAICSGGEPSSPLSVTPTPHKFWRNDKTMEPSRLSRFGLTCAVLTEDRGAALLTSYLAGFPAKTSASPATAADSTVLDPASGASSNGWFAKFDRTSSTWKTVQRSLLGDSESFSETWPRWGSMRNGASYPRPIPALPICESASGFWPTPTARDWRSGKASAATHERNSRPLSEQVGGLLNPDWVEWLMGWPIGWTALKPLEMDKFHEWRQQHGNF